MSKETKVGKALRTEVEETDPWRCAEGPSRSTDHMHVRKLPEAREITL